MDVVTYLVHPRAPERRWRGGSGRSGTLAVAGMGVYLVAFAWSMQHATYDVWAAFVIAPVIVLASVRRLMRTAALDRDAQMTGILLLALILKMVGAVVLFSVAAELYKGAADASFYHHQGAIVAESLRHGDLDVDLGEGYQLVGTGFIVLLTGIVYAVIGATRLGGALVFSWLGFWGLFLFYRAFCTGFPEGRRRRYAALVFFLPSLLFWSSSVGKEAWMTFVLGLAAWGLARFLTHRHGGLLAICAGLAGSAMVRPHVTLLVLAALAVAYALRRTRRLTWAPGTKLLGLSVLLVVGVLLVGQVEAFFGIDQLDQRSAEQVLDRTTANSSYGGSAFDAGGPDTGGLPSPLGLPAALVTVLFRPFPQEAHNAQALASSMEGLLLIVLFLAAGRTLLRLPRHALRAPYVAFACVFTALTALALSSFGNFGLIARERVQLFPLALVLLALPRARSGRGGVDAPPPVSTPAWTARRRPSDPPYPPSPALPVPPDAGPAGVGDRSQVRREAQPLSQSEAAPSAWWS